MRGCLAIRGMKRAAGMLAVVAAAMLSVGCATTQSPAAPQDIRIAGSRVFPESITSDAAGNIYTGSTGGTIYRAMPGAKEAVAWIVPSAANGLKSLFGVFVDDARGLLWACSNPNLFKQPREEGVSSLKAFDLATGALKASYDFPAGPAACNDIAIARDGTTYATETAGGRIFRLAPGASALTLFASGKDLVGVDGIAIADDGTIYINNVRQNLLQRVDRKADGSYAGLTTLQASLALGGPDGLRAIGGNRFLQAENMAGRVALVTIDGDRATIVPIRTGLNSAAVTRVGDTAYAPDGKIQYLIDPKLKGQDPDPFLIHAFPIPEQP